MNRIKIAKYLTNTARTILLIITSFWFIFALLSGAEDYGGGIEGIIKNSPNALPWVFLFGLIYLAWKKELIGGSLIMLMGFLSIIVFNTDKNLITFVLMSLSLTVLGGMLVISWFLKRKKEHYNN